MLLKPRAGGSNMVLWLAGPVMLLLGLGLGLGYIRRRGQARAAGEAKSLSDAEQARLREILKD